MSYQRQMMMLALALLGAALALGRYAPAATASPAAVQPQPAGLTDRQETEAFLDAFFAAQLAEEHVVGAAVAVVKDGELFFAKGYGYADLAGRVPVAADQTVFSTGSTGKLFIWTALMQLAEQGRLDLDADVNTYLDFAIPATYPQPITLKHLMSHTAGFDDRSALYAHSPTELEPLGAELARTIPARVRPPGLVSAYSNYGAALAGYIVERVAGMSFDRYLELYLFTPLDMRHTTFRQPLPADLSTNLAAGYRYQDGGYHVVPKRYVRLPSTGSSHTTVTDMAHFMIAHLQDGRYGTAQMLQPATSRQMHSQLFAADPRVHGMAYGFAEVTLNRQHILKHNGAYPESFNSILALLPEQGIGIYANYNTNGTFSHGEHLLQAFVDHYYPAVASPPQPHPDAPQAATQLAGTYRSTRMFETTFARLLALVPGNYADVRVIARPDGSVVTEGIGPQPLQWVLVEPGVLRLANGQLNSHGDLVFGADAQGAISWLYIQNNPYRAYEKVPWYETAGFTVGLLAACLVVFLSALAGWPLAAALNHRRGGSSAPPRTRLARWLAGGACALYLAFLPALLLTFVEALEYGTSPALIAALALPLLAGVLMVGSFVVALRAWRAPGWSRLGRAHYGLVLLAATGATWLLHTWNLLGFRF